MPELLACPDCVGPLTSEGDRLRCPCATWPVLSGIPILTPWAKNRSVSLEEAFASHLRPVEGVVAKIVRRLVRGPGRLRAALQDRDATFIEMAARLGRANDLDYFRYRFSDLSYLSSAALLTPLSRGPVLDLGCGAGHLMVALSRRIPKSLSVGLDLNFTLLYLAKRFVVPSALLVCADASARLPFRDGAFEASIAADTFQYLADGPKTARELLRVTRGPILLSHLWTSGARSAPEAFLELLAARAPRLHADRRILDAFLGKRALDLSGPGSDPGDAVSLTAGVDAKIHPGADYFVSGSMINPIYEASEQGDRLELRR